MPTIPTGQQIGGHGLERADLAFDRTVRHVTHAGDDCLLVDIEAGTVRVKNFHLILRAAPPARDVRQTNSSSRAPEPLPARGTLRGAQTSRIQLRNGLSRTKETPISLPATLPHPYHAPSPSFMPSGSATPVAN